MTSDTVVEVVSLCVCLSVCALCVSVEPRASRTSAVSLGLRVGVSLSRARRTTVTSETTLSLQTPETTRRDLQRVPVRTTMGRSPGVEVQSRPQFLVSTDQLLRIKSNGNRSGVLIHTTEHGHAYCITKESMGREGAHEIRNYRRHMMRWREMARRAASRRRATVELALS